MRTTIFKWTLALALLIIGLLSFMVNGTPATHAENLANITGTPTEPLPDTPVPPTTPPDATPTTPPETPPTSTPIAQPTALPPAPPSDGRGDRQANPFIIKTVDQSEASVGDVIGFSLTVGNDGGETADNVVLTDILPNYLELFDVTTSRGEISVDGQQITVVIGSIEPGETVLVRIRVRINDQAPEEGSNTGRITSSNGGDDPSDNISTVTFRVERPPTPTPSITPPPMTPTPTPVPPAPAAPPAAPPAPPAQPAPPDPAGLPETGAGDMTDHVIMILIALAVGLLSTGIVIRRHMR